jgi:dienelactone hydrolase
MKNTDTKRNPFYLFLVVAIFASPISIFALCQGAEEEYRKFDRTYYEIEYPALLSFDSRCRYITRQGRTICQIQLRGTLYLPPLSAYATRPGQPPATFPAIIINHGSGKSIEAEKRYCVIANYFVPKGYIVFVPFRRGQGEKDGSNVSTGIYIEDMIDDFQSPSPAYFHDTDCNDGKCYRAELFKQQADQEVADAVKYLQARTDVKAEPGNAEDHRIAIMGSSYGGAVTVFANRFSIGQKAVVAFSPGAQQWDKDEIECGPNEQNCGTPVQKALIAAARSANRPAFYLQAKWDYDTRPTMDLAYAHGYGSSDPQHSRGWNAAIYPYQNPCFTDPEPPAAPEPRPCTDDDYQKIHTGFFTDPGVWGPAVLNFLRRYDVK